MQNLQKKKRITLADVALDANVSRATASLVVRDSPLVKPATKEKVLASIEKLGYIYHRAAASMRSQKSHTIGLVTTDIINPFFAELTIGMEAYLEEKNYAVFMTNTSEQLKKQTRLLNTMREYQVDGVLLCPVNETPRDQIERLQEAQFPLVLVIRYLYDIDVDYVGIDNANGAQLAAEHLAEQGHTRIAFIGGAENASARKDRLKGFKAGLEARGLSFYPELALATSVTRDGGYKAIGELLNRPDPPTAALCYNDIVAFGVLAKLNTEGVNAGSEFAVVGFDDLADARLQTPPLTTLAVGTSKLGEQAARLLLERIDDPTLPPRKIILSPELIIRGSSTRSSPFIT